MHNFFIHLDPVRPGGVIRTLARCELAGEAEGSLAAGKLKSLRDSLARLLTDAGAGVKRELAVAAGQKLFEALMGVDVRREFQKATQAAWKRGERLRLILEQSASPDGEWAWMHSVPWEMMFDPDRDRFLAIDPDVLLVRYIRQGNPVAPFPAASPWKVLVTSACPTVCEPLDLAQELDRLEQCFRWPGMRARFRPTSCPDATMPDLRGELVRACRAEQPFHVWHHCGHGEFHEENGKYQLAFADGAWVEAGELADLLRRCDGLSLVLLNVCLGAHPNGLGAMLAGFGVPAVIGHAISVDDRIALQFSQEFWRAFATEPVDAAVQRARQLLAGSHKQLAFAHVVLFLRSLDLLSSASGRS